MCRDGQKDDDKDDKQTSLEVVTWTQNWRYTPTREKGEKEKPATHTIPIQYHSLIPKKWTIDVNERIELTRSPLALALSRAQVESQKEATSSSNPTDTAVEQLGAVKRTAPVEGSSSGSVKKTKINKHLF